MEKQHNKSDGFCTCRTDDNGNRYYECIRKACSNHAQVCGGNCAPCFERKMNTAQLRIDTDIVVLCGSTRFKTEFETITKELGLAGAIVLTVACFGHSGDLSAEQCKIGNPVKDQLDELHKRKIDIAKRVFVINPGGYIGESTRSEIEYAEWWEKPITYLEPPK